jgi:hypothetical protein
MKTKNFLTLTLLFLVTVLSAQIKSPAEFLGYELGDRFSRHSDVVSYFYHLAENSSMVKVEEYGRTYENRPLILAYIATDQNMAQLETIRTDNLKRAGIMNGATSTNVPIVWLSYNVHGNEANSTEAAMATIYALLTGDKEKTMLKNTVVIIDPCINPDGRDRYANFYNQYGNFPFNPDPQTIEHLEPWPGGRPNHYLFDLNRDWAWQTQIESKERIKEYNKWMPHVHVDFHEQGYNSPYYFAPAAQPYHELITQWQRDFQVSIGKNNAKYFDQNNWFYFTKQYFDLLYPSYGDTYPTYNGAIGMTFEQAGHGMGGLGVVTQEGDTLTLLDRLTHHTTTGLSTIEVTAQNSEKVLTEFKKFFDTPVKGTYKSFVMKAGNRDKMNHLKQWLDANSIKYGKAENVKGLRGYHYGSGQEKSFNIDRGDLVVNVNQPKGMLAKILFEPQTKLVDSLTYDITAWAVPYFYGLEAFATSTMLPVTLDDAADFQPYKLDAIDPYAYLFRWNSMKDAQFLAELVKKGIKVRYTTRIMKTNGNEFGRGSLIVAKRDNMHNPTFNETVMNLANAFERMAYPLSTGFMDGGPDVGSSDIRFIEAPKVAMLAGEGTSSTNLGALWYYMEQDLKYPTSMLYVDDVSRTDLREYNVLLMQEGSYYNLSKENVEKIVNWVKEGGKLILFQSAIRKFADSDFASISQYNSEDEKKAMEQREEELAKSAKLSRYEDAERNDANNLIPGAVFRVHLDNSHPMAFGYGDYYYSLKTTDTRYGYLSNQNVGVIKSKADHLSGFVGKNVKEKVGESLVFGVENKGRGQIVYFADNVLFRAFWHDGKLMVANSIFFVGQ